MATVGVFVDRNKITLSSPVPLPGLDLNTTDESGRTPLMYACVNPNSSLELIKFLVSRGAKTDVVTTDGSTVVHLAAVAERLDAVDYFCKSQGK